VSSVLQFRSQYLLCSANIQTCLTLGGKRRLLPTVNERPWAAALQRLLATVRRADGSLWKKGDLADRAGVRPATISALLNSPKLPKTSTLKAIGEILGVELWEFFVNDEQAAVLHTHAKQRQNLLREDDIASRIEQKLMTKFAHAIKEATRDELSGQPMDLPAKELAQPRPVVVPSRKRKR
jgi:transcriptional regulator with XRE-family HTH domain